MLFLKSNKQNLFFWNCIVNILKRSLYLYSIKFMKLLHNCEYVDPNTVLLNGRCTIVAITINDHVNN